MAGLLLFLSLEVESQHCLVHHLRHEEHELNLFLFRNSAEFILKGNGYLSFEESILLFFGHRESLVYLNSVPKLIEYAKNRYFDFGMSFVTDK